MEVSISKLIIVGIILVADGFVLCCMWHQDY